MRSTANRPLAPTPIKPMRTRSIGAHLKPNTLLVPFGRDIFDSSIIDIVDFLYKVIKFCPSSLRNNNKIDF
jgi:hypothetical protein